MFVNAVHCHIRGAADAPTRPRDALGCVEYVVVGFVKTYIAILDDLVKIPAGISICFFNQLFITTDTQVLHELGDIGIGNDFFSRMPVIIVFIGHRFFLF